MRVGFWLLLGLLVAVHAAAAEKIVIAHRGASGYLPEHTLAAYAYAHALGAHYIEPDLVRTKDGHFIALHDIHLEGTTDVEERFPDRKREDGRWYAIDFTLAEIRTLSAHERLPRRFPVGAAHFGVPTLDEVIELVQGLNQSTGREAGIYPELKEPAFHAREGQPMEADFLAILTRHGYTGPDAKCFVQCFEAPPLKRLREELKTELPLIQLIGGSAVKMVSAEGLDAIAAYANGIGPEKGLVERDPALVARAHARGLKVHPYTVRRDAKPPAYPTTQDELRALFFTHNVDGLFADFPDDAVAVLREGPAAGAPTP
jgi:glycerophosphoryl diester phosphodiesterase